MSIDWGGPWWIAVIFLALASIFWARKYESRKLGKDLYKASIRLGMEISTDTPFSDFQSMGIALFQKGWSRKFKYVFSKVEHGKPIILGEYSYIFGFHPQKTFTQTVAIFFRPNLPEFALHPSTMLDRIGVAFGMGSVQLPFGPAFQKAYLLQGKDPGRVLELLSPGLASSLEQAGNKWSVEGAGNWLVLYKWDQTASLEKMEQFLLEASLLRQKFH